MEQGYPGDINTDGSVDFADFLTLSSNFGKSNAVAADGDIDGDGTVGFADFLALSANFGDSAIKVDLTDAVVNDIALGEFFDEQDDGIGVAYDWVDRGLVVLKWIVDVVADDDGGEDDRPDETQVTGDTNVISGDTVIICSGENACNF